MAMKDKERGRRSARIRTHYNEWILEGQEAIDIQFVQTALKSFQEVMENLSPDTVKGTVHVKYILCGLQLPKDHVI